GTSSDTAAAKTNAAQDIARLSRIMTISPGKYVDKCTPWKRRGNASSPSIQLRAGELHQLRVFLVLRAHQRVELLGRARADADAEPGDLVVDLRRRNRGDDACVQFRDDVARHTHRHENAEHRRHVE